MEPKLAFSAGPVPKWGISKITLLELSLALWLVFHLVKAVYNISPLHPLHKIPGPKLAAATYLPEIYWDVLKFGRYTHQIQRMHEVYGPLVRISPSELHCADVGFSDEIYAGGNRKRNKPAHQVNGTLLTVAEFGTVDHDLHRARRAPVAKFFSGPNVARLEGEIKAFVQQLCDKLLRERGKGPVELKAAYSCFTADVTSAYAFGHSIGLLDQAGWTPNFKEPTDAALQACHVLRWLPFLKRLDKLATLFVDYLPASIALFVRTMQIELPRQVEQTREAMNAGLLNSHGGRRTIFADILMDEETDSKEKETYRLGIEAFSVMSAGTETTASAISIITYHILKQPATLARLAAELQQNGLTERPRELPSFPDLEKLPYLNAVIKEGLRLSYGVSSRTARIATEEDLVYRGEWNKKDVEHVIPRGYAIGMSTAITHHDESIFPDSHRFYPERWLDEEGRPNKDPERGLMVFSRGSRRCLASNLAITELNFTITALSMRVWPRMELFETTDDDMVYDHDMFIPMPKDSSNGLRVTIL